MRTGAMRVSVTRVLVLALAVGGAGWLGTAGVRGLVDRADRPGPSTFVGYVDVTATPAFSFETPAGPAQSRVVLSFVVADPTAPCVPSWGGYYGLDAAEGTLELDRRIRQLRSTGGDVAVSFGGQAGTSLATACTDEERLRRAYADVVDRYSLTSIDLDVEGAALADAEGVRREAAAVAAVQADAAAAGRPLEVWLTLPVGRSGLTAAGQAAVRTTLAAGVDLAGVNGMTMDFGVVTGAGAPLADVVQTAAGALHRQVAGLWRAAGHGLSDSQAWGRVGLTVMIGQSDVAGEVFTLADATRVNELAREHGVGRVAMWSLNRDVACTSPLPTVLTVVQTGCSGVDQGGSSFADVLAADLERPVRHATPTPSDTAALPAPAPSPSTSAPVVDDPAHSPYPIWDPYGTYPGGTKIVWHGSVYQARFWTAGAEPGRPTASEWDTPWSLLGPVLPGDTPAPLPTLPAGTYPQWDPAAAYVGGSRVQVGLVPYVAKWWSQGQEPGVPVPGGSPWVLVYPEG